MRRRIVAFIVFFSAFAGVASAGCEYCGNRLICEGDTIAKLLEFCGQPSYTHKVKVKKRAVEQWFYKNPYGALSAVRTYTIDSGKINKIE